MALRDKLRDGSKPFIPDDEPVRHVWMAQTGPNPMWFLLTFWMVFWVKYRVIVITDSQMHLLKKSFWTARSTELLASVPRSAIETASGLWAKTTVAGEEMWVHKRFHQDVAAANRTAPSSATLDG